MGGCAVIGYNHNIMAFLYTLKHNRPQTHAYTHAHSLTHTQTHTHTHTLSHTHTHTHTHTHWSIDKNRRAYKTVSDKSTKASDVCVCVCERESYQFQVR